MKFPPVMEMARSWSQDRRTARNAGITGWLFVRIWLVSWRIGYSGRVTDPSEASMAAHTWAEKYKARRSS